MEEIVIKKKKEKKKKKKKRRSPKTFGYNMFIYIYIYIYIYIIVQYKETKKKEKKNCQNWAPHYLWVGICRYEMLFISTKKCCSILSDIFNKGQEPIIVIFI